MENSIYTWADQAWARLLGLPDDPDALEFARKLRCVNESVDELHRLRIKRSAHEVMDDLDLSDGYVPKAA